MTPNRAAGTPRVTDTSVARQERLRFSNFVFERTPSGQVNCLVSLEYGPGELISGKVSGQASSAGDVRLGAEATIRALESFTEGSISFDLIGVKVVRAFDANIVISSLMQRGDDGPERLLGCYLAEGDLVRGAALSVLNATNRVMANFILTR